MEVEHVAGVGLTAGGAPQQQGQGAVGHGVLGQIVVDNEHVLALGHKVLRDGHAGIGGDVLHRGGLAGGGTEDDAVLHGAALFQAVVNLGHSGVLLADCHVDADDVLALLVQDGVNGDGGLAGLAVADNQLPLATADGHHGVHGQDARLQRHGDRLPGDNAGGLPLDGHGGRGVDGPLAVDGVAQGVDDAAQHLLPSGDIGPAAGAAHQVPFLNALLRAQQGAAHAACLQVHGQGAHPVFKLQKLAVHDVFQAIHGGNTVPDLNDGAGFADLGLLLILGNFLFQYGYDFFRFAVQSSFPLFQRAPQAAQHAPHALVVSGALQVDDKAAQQLRLQLYLELHLGKAVAAL